MILCQAARLSAWTTRSQPSSRFQLAKFRLTTFPKKEFNVLTSQRLYEMGLSRRIVVALVRKADVSHGLAEIAQRHVEGVCCAGGVPGFSSAAPCISSSGSSMLSAFTNGDMHRYVGGNYQNTRRSLWNRVGCNVRLYRPLLATPALNRVVCAGRFAAVNAA